MKFHHLLTTPSFWPYLSFGDDRFEIDCKLKVKIGFFKCMGIMLGHPWQAISDKTLPSNFNPARTEFNVSMIRMHSSSAFYSIHKLQCNTLTHFCDDEFATALQGRWKCNHYICWMSWHIQSEECSCFTRIFVSSLWIWTWSPWALSRWSGLGKHWFLSPVQFNLYHQVINSLLSLMLHDYREVQVSKERSNENVTSIL